jgi:hypothetical protein
MESSLRPLTPVDTSALFTPLHGELIHLLSGLARTDWALPTVTGSWRVRDVVAHLIDGQMRRPSIQRDGVAPPAPRNPVEDYESLVAHLNDLNAEWVRAMRRVSERQLLALLEHVGPQYADFMAGMDPDGIALFPVAWAGEGVSKNWMGVGRD